MACQQRRQPLLTMPGQLEPIRPLTNITSRCWTCGGTGSYAYGTYNRLWECFACECIRNLEQSCRQIEQETTDPLRQLELSFA